MNHPSATSRELTSQRLHEEEQRLLRDLSDIADEDPMHPGAFLPKPPELQNATDDDSSTEATAAADAAIIIDRLQEELRDVRNARESLAHNTYGICKYCKNPIDPKRLEARPASSSCVSCKKTLTQEL